MRDEQVLSARHCSGGFTWIILFALLDSPVKEGTFFFFFFGISQIRKLRLKEMCLDRGSIARKGRS